MTGKLNSHPQIEPTEAGEQTPVCGVQPVTLRDRLAIMAVRPMLPKRNPYAQQSPVITACLTRPHAIRST